MTAVELINFDFDDMNEKLDRIEAKLDEIKKLLNGVDAKCNHINDADNYAMDGRDGEDGSKNMNTPSNQSSTYRSGFSLFVTP